MRKIFIILSLLWMAVGCAQTRVIHDRDVAIRSSRRVYFDLNRSEVRDEDRATLESVAKNLQRKPKTIAILEGHADRTGPAHYNEVLAEKRARAVRVYLRNLGASHRQLTITSKGEREPLDRAWTPEAHQKNRRVEILMTLTGDNF